MNYNDKYQIINEEDLYNPEKLLINRDFRTTKQPNNLIIIDSTDTTHPDFKYRLNKETYINFKKLQKYLLQKLNIQIKVDGAFRTIQRQEEIYNKIEERKIKQITHEFLDKANQIGYQSAIYEYGTPLFDILVEKAKQETYKTVAPKGASEHHSGFAIDLSLYLDGEELKASENKEIYNYYYEEVHKYLNDFGFILRYPKDEQSKQITKYNYEPWHIRYTGLEISQKMKDNNILTLEEYLRPDLYKRKQNTKIMN